MNFCKLLSIAIISGSSMSASAQSSNIGPSTLNDPSPDTITGPIAGSTVDQSAHEQVAVATGQLNLLIPILKLPQHGGRTLTLGYVLSSNTWAAKETSVHYQYYGIANASNPLSWWLEDNASFGYVQTQSGLGGTALNWNTPFIHADLMYAGVTDADAGGLPNYVASQCVTNWTFVDWQGASHAFRGYRDCTSTLGQFEPGTWTKGQQASDDSGYVINFDNLPDIRVVDPEGVVYHFSGYRPPAINNTAGSATYYQQSPYYAAGMNSMVDPNGNTVTLAGGVLTDTTGLQITFNSNGGVSWPYQSSPSSSITTASVSRSDTNSGVWVPLPTNQIPSCQAKTGYNGEAQAAGYHGVGFQPPDIPLVATSYTTTITLPDSTYYQLTYDMMSRPIKIRYPAGGYTRYDYDIDQAYTGGGQQDNGDMMCTHPRTRVVAKHECTLANGACSPAPQATYLSCQAGAPAGGEATTCYTGSSVVDPMQNTTLYSFTLESTDTSGGGFGSFPAYHPPLESGRAIYNPGSSTPIRTVATSFAPPTGCPGGGENCLPAAANVTTTYNDMSPAQSSTVVQKFQFPHLPTLIQEQDFSGNVVQQTSITYMSGGVYGPVPCTSSCPVTRSGLNNILDRVQSRTESETATGKSRSATYTYDSFGNLLNSETSGTGVSNARTQYSPNAQGDNTSIQDPMQSAGSHVGSTTFAYTDQAIPGCPHSGGPGAPTLTTDALGHTTKKSFYPIGSLACVQDANGNTTQYSYDQLGRPSSVSDPDGGSTSYSVSSTIPLTFTSEKVASPSPTQITTSIADGYGRVVQTKLSAPEGTTCTERYYDASGRLSATDDPNLACPNVPGTPLPGASISYQYDALGRKTLQTNEDGTFQQWSYSGPTTTFTDEANHRWQRTSDALGRLTQVLEPAVSEVGIGNGTPETDYAYDGFGNLWTVTQKGIGGEAVRSRAFTYDGYSRIGCASNPENSAATCVAPPPPPPPPPPSPDPPNPPDPTPGPHPGPNPNTANPTSLVTGGVTTYNYDLNGNLVAKTDAGGVTTNLSYDALNRLTGKSYSGSVATPSSCYRYDMPSAGANLSSPLGNLTAEWTQSESCPLTNADVPAAAISWRKVISNDVMGRITAEQQCPFGPCAAPNPVQYTYNLAGALTSSSNGVPTSGSNGIDFTYTSDGAGRLSSLTSDRDPFDPMTLFKADATIGTPAYGPFGLLAAQFAVPSNSQQPAFTQSRAYDARGRITSILTAPAAGASVPSASISLTPSAVPAGVYPVLTSTCTPNCTAAVGGNILVDGALYSGFTYAPSQVTQQALHVNFSAGQQHTAQVRYFDGAGNVVASSQVLTFNVSQNNTLPAPNFTINLDPQVVPLGESATITVQGSCGAQCADADIYVDGTWAGGLTFDETGTATNQTNINLAVNSHTLMIDYFGNGTSAHTQSSITFQVVPATLPNPVIQVTSITPNPVPSDEYGYFNITLSCGANCRPGQYFIDGNFAGGYAPDNTGSTVLQSYPGLRENQQHSLTINYPGDNNFKAFTTPPTYFNVVPDTLPRPVVTIAQPSSVPAGQYTPATVTVIAAGAPNCGGFGKVFTDGNYSGYFIVNSDGSTYGGAYFGPTTAGTHTLTANYLGSATCAPNPGSVQFQSQ